MEVVSDLTTEAFIAALKRFIGRRGHCRKLYCDNATNFVGAKNSMEELQQIIHADAAQEKIQNECRRKNIEFLFIPPRAPHFGGLWEAAVKSAKKLLLNTLSSASLTYEEMETVIIEAEAILNSRPITPMSSNPNDFQALTPGHFLIGEPLVSTIDATAKQATMNNSTRWRLITQLKAEFWQRWVKEYLSSLQHRNKWKQELHNIEPGTMVIIKEDNLPSMRWPLGRVIKAIPGPDGLVRVADVQTATNICRRPIHRLAPLPIEEIQEELQDTAEVEQQARPIKRRRIERSALLMTILAISFMLPLCIATPIEVLPFATNPGIYYEKIGTAGIAASEWTLISYIDMRSYWKKFEIINKYPLALHKVSNGSQSVIVNMAAGLLNELTMQNQLLRPHSYKRTKRGAINIVGNVANSLFGILDSNYAEKAEREIDMIRQNEDYLLEHIQNQTSFLDATATLFKKSQEQVNRELQHVASVLDQLENKITAEMAFSELSIQAVFDMLQFERLQDALIEVLLSSHHGKISPKQISPSKLKHELDNIKANLPNQLRLPASTDKLLNFYKLIKIEGRARNDYIIFKLTLDLLSDEDFEVLKLNMVPFQSNQGFYQIQSQFKTIVINLHRDRYLPLKETEMDSCNLVDDEFFICYQRYPLYKKGATVALCEVQLLSHETNSSCKVERTDSGPHWIQLQDPNQWIYSVQDQYTVNTVCGSTPSQVILQNSGILRLRADCNIKQPEITIQGYQRLKTKGQTFYVPTNDIGSVINVPCTTTQRTKIKSFASEIEELQAKLSQIHTKLPNNFRVHDVHHYTMTYLCLIMLIVMSCVSYWKFKKKCID